MIKFILLFFIVIGFVALSMAFIPAVWFPLDFVIPATSFHPAIGHFCLLGLIWVSWKAIS